MKRIRIEYCHDCMFLSRATEIAKDLLDHFPDRLAAVELAIGGEGVFNIRLGDMLIFEMGEDGIQPAVEAIRDLISDRLT